MEENQPISPEQEQEYKFRLRYEQEQEAEQQHKEAESRKSREPGMLESAVGMGGALASTAAGVVGDVVKPVVQHIAENPVLDYVAYKALETKPAQAAIQAAKSGSTVIRDIALQGLRGGASAVRGAVQAVSPQMINAGRTAVQAAPALAPVAPFAATAAVPAAMMYNDYRNFKQQTPQQQQESAQSALAGQSPGQAYY